MYIIFLELFLTMGSLKRWYARKSATPRRKLAPRAQNSAIEGLGMSLKAYLTALLLWKTALFTLFQNMLCLIIKRISDLKFFKMFCLIPTSFKHAFLNNLKPLLISHSKYSRSTLTFLSSWRSFRLFYRPSSRFFVF